MRLVCRSLMLSILARVNSMEIKSVMKRKVVKLPAASSLGDAVRLFVAKRVGLLPVVDDDTRLVGVLNLRDILQMAWPSALDIVEDIDFIHSFGSLEDAHIPPELLEQPVGNFMQQAISIEETCGLLRGAALMSRHRLRDLPVVDSEGRVVGLASWVDVGAAFLATWADKQGDE